VRILGQNYPVKARIEQLPGFSAHADRNELFRWLSSLQKSPKKVFITHGEPESALSFADLIRERKGWNVEVPEYRQTVVLE